MDYGTETGEMCNREGCAGIIEQYETDSQCSCHIHPPCSYCVDDRHYCPICNWQGIDEQNKLPNYLHPSGAQGLYNRMMDREYNYRLKIDEMRSGKRPIVEIEWYPQGHTNFSMKKIGVYPKGKEEEVRKLVEGTFGGRFEQFGNGKFIYIAYTD